MVVVSTFSRNGAWSTIVNNQNTDDLRGCWATISVNGSIADSEGSPAMIFAIAVDDDNDDVEDIIYSYMI